MSSGARVKTTELLSFYPLATDSVLITIDGDPHLFCLSPHPDLGNSPGGRSPFVHFSLATFTSFVLAVTLWKRLWLRRPKEDGGASDPATRSPEHGKGTSPPCRLPLPVLRWGHGDERDASASPGGSCVPLHLRLAVSVRNGNGGNGNLKSPLLLFSASHGVPCPELRMQAPQHHHRPHQLLGRPLMPTPVSAPCVWCWPGDGAVEEQETAAAACRETVTSGTKHHETGDQTETCSPESH